MKVALPVRGVSVCVPTHHLVPSRGKAQRVYVAYEERGSRDVVEYSLVHALYVSQVRPKLEGT